MGVDGPLAGKTGTTNDRRDSWFAGYSPDRTTVVWVGYDDNSSTSLSGSRAAVPLWARFTAAVEPPGGYRNFAQPAGVTTATIDPTTGLLATDACPYRITEVYPRGAVPDRTCHVHQYGGWYGDGRRADGTDGDGDYPDGAHGRDRGDGRAPGADPDAPAAERDDERRGGFRSWLRRVFREDDDGGNGDGNGNGDGGGEQGGADEGDDGGEAPREAPAPG
jgi:membrane peptidoglycan carboxypeptidase